MVAETMRLKRDLGRLLDAARTDDSRAVVSSMIANVEALDAKLREARRAHQIAVAEKLGARNEREKAYQDGYAQGLADGFGECSALMSRMTEARNGERDDVA